jgi:hypothetical protein
VDGKTEVGDFPPITRFEDVSWLQVSMDDMMLVKIFITICDIFDNVDGLYLGESTFFGKMC